MVVQFALARIDWRRGPSSSARHDEVLQELESRQQTRQ
jgi:hypothetical protein